MNDSVTWLVIVTTMQVCNEKSPSGVKKKVQNVQFGEKKDTNKLNVSMNACIGGSL